MAKYIFVVGGVMSGVGKGVASASIGKILQSKGFRVSAVKIDAYINVDAGTMNPTEHGEVFVTEDGDETDQDLGNYERFLHENIYSSNYLTTGRVYLSVIQRERNLEYKGKCVEVVPHIPEEVIRRIKEATEKTKSDIMIVEIGGTVGEYQNILFLEAARMMHLKQPDDIAFVLVSYLPIPSKIGEMKTKPTQYAARTLNSAGIQPDFILCRSERPLDEPRIKKVALFGSIDEEHVVSAPDTDIIYEIPLNFEKADLGNKILKKFKLEPKSSNLEEWKKTVNFIKNPTGTARVGIVGKYFGTGEFILPDAYISVIEAIKHACWSKQLSPEIEWIDSEKYETDQGSLKDLDNYHGIIVPGGFGTRGVEGKIKAAQYAREKNIPYLGLCYGMHILAIDYARNVIGLPKANTTEIDPDTPDPIIYIIPNKEFEETKKYGGTMRLGAYPCVLDENSKSFGCYGTNEISERHRHRYEFNNSYIELFEKHGVMIAGKSPDNELVEILEIKDHPFFVGVQFHPEFKSRLLQPHPLFKGLIETGVKLRNL